MLSHALQGLFPNSPPIPPQISPKNHSQNTRKLFDEYKQQKSLPFISAQRFKLKTKAQPFDVSLCALNFCSQDAILIFNHFLIDL